MIYGVGCTNRFNMDLWCILPKLMDYGNLNYDLEKLVELVLQITELMEVFWVLM